LSAWCIRRGLVETREALHPPNRLEATLSTKWLMAEMAKSSPVCTRGVRVHWKGRSARRRPTHRPSQRRPTLGPAPDMSARHRLLKMARGSRKWPLAKSSPMCARSVRVHWKGRTARRRPTRRPSQRRPTLGPAPDMSARHRLLKMARREQKITENYRKWLSLNVLTSFF